MSSENKPVETQPTGLNSLMQRIQEGTKDKRFRAGLWSSHTEYPILFNLIPIFNIQNVIEIGTCNGASALTFAVSLKKHKQETGEVHTIDITSMPGLDEETEFNSKITRHVSGPNRLIRTIRHGVKGNTLFFIDGDHSYKGVLEDGRTCFLAAVEGDILVFHDLNVEQVKKAIDTLFAATMQQVIKINSPRGIAVVVV